MESSTFGGYLVLECWYTVACLIVFEKLLYSMRAAAMYGNSLP